MLACRLTIALLAYSASGVATIHLTSSGIEKGLKQCRLYYQFSQANLEWNKPRYEFGLSAILFEFPSARDGKAVAGESVHIRMLHPEDSFGVVLGRVV